MTEQRLAHVRVPADRPQAVLRQPDRSSEIPQRLVVRIGIVQHRVGVEVDVVVGGLLFCHNSHVSHPFSTFGNQSVKAGNDNSNARRTRLEKIYGVTPR